MSKRRKTRVFPHWSSKPPHGYPFEIEPLNFEEPLISKMPLADELEIINKCGKELLQSGDYQDALWKFENCLFVVLQDRYCYQPEKIVKYAGNCALALLKLHETTKSQFQQKKALKLCKSFCQICFEQDEYVYTSKLEKVTITIIIYSAQLMHIYTCVPV